MDAEDLAYAGVAKQAELMAAGSISSVELVQASLDRIKRHDGLLNAFRVTAPEEALAAAAEADRSRSSDSGPLHGVPVAIKDDTDVAGYSTRYGSNATTETPKSEDAELVKRLRSAGAILVGKTNVPELTQWPFTETDAFGVTRNPWNPSLTPGGSSGGSAAAVAAGMVPVALASDGGGSIRIPAACAGLFGIKPQRGRVPIAPKTDAWFGLSVFGPLARSVEDAAIFLDAIADRPAGEALYRECLVPPPAGLRIATSVKPPIPGPVGDEQKQAVSNIAALLGRLGHKVSQSDPNYGLTIPAFVIRYLRGIAKDAAATADPDRLEARTKAMARGSRLFGDRALDWSMRAEVGITAGIGRLFGEYDLLVTPGLAAQPLPIGRYAGRGATWTFNGVARFTPFAAPWNLTGQPAVSVPAGFDRDGVPLAVQIVGPANSEPLLFAISAQIEAELPWADRRPSLTS